MANVMKRRQLETALFDLHVNVPNNLNVVQLQRFYGEQIAVNIEIEITPLLIIM